MIALVVVIVFAVLAGAGVALMGVAAHRAPMGWQDERGFHYGEKGDDGPA